MQPFKGWCLYNHGHGINLKEAPPGRPHHLHSFDRKHVQSGTAHAGGLIAVDCR